jgi:hypothetical protein
VSPQPLAEAETAACRARSGVTSTKVVIRRRPRAREGRFNPQEEPLELAIHQNKIINTFDRIGSREKERASDAGEDREEIGRSSS